MQGDKTVYELGNGIEIHVTRDGKVLHIILSQPPDELDITETTLGQLLLKRKDYVSDMPQLCSTLLH
jgi:hypothetical protein